MASQAAQGFTSNFVSNQNFSFKQLNNLIDLINAIINKKNVFHFFNFFNLFNASAEFNVFNAFDEFEFIEYAQFNEHNALKIIDIKFFNSKYKNNEINVFVLINANKHIFYKNIYVFIDRIKNVTITYENDKIKEIIFIYFRDEILI